MPCLGCIADDFTGGTDLSNNLVKRGFRTVQTLGVPSEKAEWYDADAIVVALKSRTIPSNEAVRISLEALQWLRSIGCSQFYFKYCSTFDSTSAGNIGPVIDALLDQLGEPVTIVCPAFPDNGRTVYRGHLFVHDRLLNESGMQNHPLTPMTDSNLLRLLSAQTASPIGLLGLEVITQGAASVRRKMTELRGSGVRMVITDATSNQDLLTIGTAVSDLKLMTGGSGLALGLPMRITDVHAALAFRMPVGPRAILAGSCSETTLAQIAYARETYPAFHLKPLELHRDNADTMAEVIAWAREQLNQDRTFIIYTSGDPMDVRAVQAKLGPQRSNLLVEDAFSSLASQLVAAGVRQLIVAGGETSGAVVNALRINALRIGKEISPGVPWTLGLGGPYPVALALKSGNFGGTDFFMHAWEILS
jgi:3-dehydrotetronate 4-kinase